MKNLILVLKVAIYLVLIATLAFAIFILVMVAFKSLFQGDLIKFIGAVTVIYYGFKSYDLIREKFNFNYHELVGN